MRFVALQIALVFTVGLTWDRVAGQPNPKALSQPNLYRIVVNKQLGFIDRSGRVVIQPKFPYSNRRGSDGRFHEGLAAVCLGQGRCGFIDSTGNFVIEPKFDELGDFSEGLATFDRGTESGYLDSQGKIVLTTRAKRESGQWSLLRPTISDKGVFSQFHEGLAAVATDGGVGFIGKDGSFKIPARFRFAYPFSEGVAAVYGEVTGYINHQGKVVIGTTVAFERVYPFVNGLAIVRVGGKYGFIDREGAFVLKPQYDLAYPFSENGLAKVSDGTHVRFIDRSGRTHIGPIGSAYLGGDGPHTVESYEALRRFLPESWTGGYYSIQPAELQAMRADVVGFGFSDGLAPFRDSRQRFIYIDRRGRTVVGPKWNGGLGFYRGLALVADDRLMAYIDRTGKIVWSTPLQ